jgi:hypothetical protein
VARNLNSLHASRETWHGVHKLMRGSNYPMYLTHCRVGLSNTSGHTAQKTSKCWTYAHAEGGCLNFRGGEDENTTLC